MKIKTIALAAFGLLAAGATAEDLYANAFNSTNLLLIDSNAGTGTVSVNTGISSWNAMESEGANIYGTTFTGQGLYWWTLANPAAIFVGQPGDIRGMAYDGTTMWASRNSATGADELVTVNLVAGLAFVVGAMNFSSVEALAVNGSQLYAWDIDSGLLTIDTSTGLATDVSAQNGGTADIQGMDFGVGGELFGVGESLYTIDTATGAFAAVGPGGLGDNRGLVAGVPEPNTLVGLAFAGILLVMRKRRVCR